MMVREVVNGALHTSRRRNHARTIERVVEDLGVASTGWHLRIAPWLHLAGSQLFADRVAKRPEYLRLGVNHLWLLTPAERILEPFLRDGSHWTIKCASIDDEPVRAAPFDAVELSMTPWWLPPDPPPPDQPR